MESTAWAGPRRLRVRLATTTASAPSPRVEQTSADRASGGGRVAEDLDVDGFADAAETTGSNALADKRLSQSRGALMR